MYPRPYLKTELQASNFTVELAFQTMGLDKRTTSSHPIISDAHDHVTFGCAEEALRWISDAELPSSEEEALRKFVSNFEGCLFCHEDATRLNEAEARYNVKFPEWFRKLWQALTFVMPQYFSQVQFGHLPGWDAPSDLPYRLWYELRLRGVDQDDQRGIIDV